MSRNSSQAQKKAKADARKRKRANQKKNQQKKKEEAMQQKAAEELGSIWNELFFSWIIEENRKRIREEVRQAEIAQVAKLASLSDREKRALAAEQRLARSSGNSNVFSFSTSFLLFPFPL